MQTIIAKDKSKHIPLEFKLNLVNGNIFDTDVIKTNPTIVFFMKPGCSNCKVEAKFISANINRIISKYNIIIILFSDLNVAKPFLKNYLDFTNDKMIIVGLDPNYKLSKTYNINLLPTCIIFNSNKIQINRITVPLTSMIQIDSYFDK